MAVELTEHNESERAVLRGFSLTAPSAACTLLREYTNTRINSTVSAIIIETYVPLHVSTLVDSSSGVVIIFIIELCLYGEPG
jgi:hypothetical protein